MLLSFSQHLIDFKISPKTELMSVLSAIRHMPVKLAHVPRLFTPNRKLNPLIRNSNRWQLAGLLTFLLYDAI
jgi:hypothetical protein